MALQWTKFSQMRIYTDDCVINGTNDHSERGHNEKYCSERRQGPICVPYKASSINNDTKCFKLRKMFTHPY